LTAEPVGSLVPGRGFWEITLPAFTFAENALRMLPTEQRAFLIAVLAARSLLPVTLGTRHRDDWPQAAVFRMSTATGDDAMPSAITRSSARPRGAQAGSVNREDDAALGAIDLFVIPKVRAYVTVPPALLAIWTSG
jgi:hypothetical protein